MGEAQRGDLEFGTLPGVLRVGAERHADRIAIEDGEVRLTYAALAGAAREVTRALMARGIERGDRVGIWAPNLWEWIVAALGAQGAGATLIPINTRYKGAEAADILARGRARLLFTVGRFLDTDYPGMLAEHLDAMPALEGTIVLRGDPAEAPVGLGPVGWSEFLAAGAAISDTDADARAATVEPDDLCDIMFTSGTTGRPKGVLCTHGQTTRAFRDWSEVTGLRAGDRYLVVVPFFHSFGYKAGWLAALMMGATVLPQPVFDVGEVFRRVSADRVTVLPGPPALYQTILARPDLAEHDLSSLRLAVTGAASIPVELIERMRDELTFDTIITGYGLTEATGIATMCRFDDDPETIARTSGRAIPGVEVRVAADDLSEVRRGEPGEVLVRGYNVMQGYLDDAESTAETITEGWLHTGDIGVMDDRGYLRITDRKKDMFIVGGFNAYPAEIEAAMAEHPAIAMVSVVGMPDPRLGEVGCAFVVARPDADIAADALIAWCRERMANFKVPRRVELVDALPLNATGKVQKFVLRARAAALS
jgi:acyl-CoA synthetase (AMP-forming)/AMP-acid ligase II